MEISRMSLLEIYVNPKDLYFAVGKPKGGDKFFILITRGPGHEYKHILSSQDVFENRDKAVKVVHEILETSVREGNKSIKDKGDFFARLNNPNNLAIEDLPMLTTEMVADIIKYLGDKDSVDLSELPASA